MVLSNKKLKQKLRAEIAETLTSAEKPDPNDSSKRNPDPNLQPQSLRQLLNSVTPKPRLSKREKKRKRSQEDSEAVNSKNSGGGNTKDEGEKEDVVEENKEGDKKKRNRTSEKSEESKNLVGDGAERKDLDLVGDGSENGEKKKKKKKKKKKEKGEEEIGDVKEASQLKKNKKKKKQKKKKSKKNEEQKKGGDRLVADGETNKGSDSQVNGDVATKVYVGGIPYNASESDIRTYFEGCGTITEIDYMTFPDSGKFRGIAIITFRTEGAAKRALALDGFEMDGLFLKIQPYKTTRATKTSDFAPKIVEGYNRTYVGNLSWDITEEDLKKLFSDCKISSIRFGTDKETGEFGGFAHVDFSDSLSLSMALKLDQHIVCGRPVKISCAVPLKKKINIKSKSVPTDNIASSNVTDNMATSDVTDNFVSSNVTDNSGPAAVSGKIRRRTCYECGEKGHLSSACPRKTAGQASANSG